MYRILITFIFLLSFVALCQKTHIEGVVHYNNTGEPLPFVKVQFIDSKIGVFTDTAGRYVLDTYYATDSLIFRSSGFVTLTIAVQKTYPKN